MSLAFYVVRDRASCIDSTTVKRLETFRGTISSTMQFSKRFSKLSNLNSLQPLNYVTADLSDEYEFPMKLNS